MMFVSKVRRDKYVKRVSAMLTPLFDRLSFFERFLLLASSVALALSLHDVDEYPVGLSLTP